MRSRPLWIPAGWRRRAGAPTRRAGARDRGPRRGGRCNPLVILDQFEDRFLYEPDDDDGFDDELARCVNRRDLRANFLISVREDAYSLLGHRFKARIPNIYGNYLHLDFLDERAAREAVLEPVRAFNERLAADAPRFEVETALVDAVLEQVRRGACQHRRRRGTGRRRGRSGPRGNGVPAARHEATVG